MAMTSQMSCSSMSNHTKERVTMAKVTLENFYSNLISQHEEREMRQQKLEKVMDQEGLGDEEVSFSGILLFFSESHALLTLQTS
uniref:Serine/threonine-protein kinase 38 n=1 Tax=Sinocyclocheilus grahami TaxID=75366 RepID=A0A672KDN4_SINGR